MKSRKIYILSLLLGAAAALPVSVRAQLTGAVTVEGDYEPDVIHPDRINMLPGVTKFKTDRTPLPYELEGIAPGFDPSFLPLPATAWRAQWPRTSQRGYLDLSLGSWLNSNLSAGVNILSDSDQRLGVRLQHNSTSLWKPYPDIDARRYSYQESLGVDYSRRFEDKGTLSAALQYRLGLFNYYAYMPLNGGKMPTQTLNDIAFRLGWRSVRPDESGSEYYAALRGRYFGYRVGDREFDLGVEGGYSFAWSAGSRLGIDASVDVLLYSASAAYTAPDNYGMVRLTPFYEFGRDMMRLRLGADIDITANADGSTPDTHYGAFHFAPDVKFDIRGRSVGFYVHALGGTELHTLAATSQLDPYCDPALLSTQPVYTPIDGRLGLEFGPFRGFSAGIEGRFKYSMHIPTEGWYGTMLNGYPLQPTDLSGMNLAGFSIGLRLRYSLGEVLGISADGSFQPQGEKYGYFNGLDRPRWIVGAEVTCRPVKQLSLGASYRLRSVRNITQRVKLPVSSDVIINGGEGAANYLTRLPDTSTLDFNAAWNFTPDFAVTFRAANLLNRHETLLPDLMSEGICFYGGLSLNF